MSICHCLSVKKRVSVKNVKILEMSDFGNTERNQQKGKGALQNGGILVSICVLVLLSFRWFRLPIIT